MRPSDALGSLGLMAFGALGEDAPVGLVLSVLIFAVACMVAARVASKLSGMGRKGRR